METLHQLGSLAPVNNQRPYLKIRANIHSTSPLCLHSVNKNLTVLKAQGKGFGVPVSIKNEKSQEKENMSYDTENGGTEDGEDAIPQVVVNRMLRRILIVVGTPMASGVGLLYLLSFIQKGQLWDVPGWLPFLTILLSFGTSALGIAYGTLSTSWDPQKEGSFLGWEQVQKNWPEIWKDEEKR